MVSRPYSLDSPETNLLDILLDQYNNVYAGTEPNGLVIRLHTHLESHRYCTMRAKGKFIVL